MVLAVHADVERVSTWHGEDETVHVQNVRNEHRAARSGGAGREVHLTVYAHDFLAFGASERDLHVVAPYLVEAG